MCFPCGQHRHAAQGNLADAVAPVAYAIKRTQHAHSLAVYKATPPSAQAKRSLSSLAVMFIAFHWECLTGAVGGSFTHIVTVPSTRSRPGPHPLESMVAERVGLPTLRPIANPAYPAEDRGFRADRFLLPRVVPEGSRILLIDDTWTTGGRLQSLAFALKSSGAEAVAAVVLGRHVNPDYEPAKPLINRLRSAPWFDLDRCALEDGPPGW
ncbi:phosphoribosyltransferase [Actinoplanes sp. NPDC023936]|uniref:phosphoribosyltransferase n=1 Tax=Actinoplanes sp. NPDC023936 TaxID=3154910 RepID=UPI0033D8B92C